MEFQHKKGYWESEYKIDANVNSVSYSPDGKFLATVCNDGKARIFNLKTGKKVMEFQHGGGVNSVSFSPDGKFLATGCGDKKARIFNIETGKVVFQQTQENEVASVSFSPDGLYLAANDKIYRTLLGLKSIDAPPTISRPPVLTASISLSEPSGNQILDALEKGNIRLKVANSGEGTAEGLTVKLTPQLLKGLSYSNAYIAEIQAGKSIEIDIPLEAYIEVEDGTHTLAISFEEANGFPPNPLNLTFETRAFRKPVVQIADIGIDDNNKNGKIEAGEMIELTLRMKNNGEGTASGAYALFYAGENVFITDKYPKTQSIGDLQSGQSKDLKLEIFINERCANEIPLYADLTEATGLAGVSKLRIPITKSDQVRPITSVVVSGINSSFTQSEESSLQIDVERNIPIAVRENNDDFAVIFGVEIYAGSIPRALYALRDATWFREYAQKAFGIPEQNI
ncbi:MAG TPA: hypothetical protein PKI59_06255, partial [Candidatus Cloacimonadota bacterium]|nr:hypothetical protein [Candidatus Cloacimonadota bacterium]